MILPLKISLFTKEHLKLKQAYAAIDLPLKILRNILFEPGFHEIKTEVVVRESTVKREIFQRQQEADATLRSNLLRLDSTLRPPLLSLRRLTVNNYWSRRSFPIS
jgi:hypothetical protein